MQTKHSSVPPPTSRLSEYIQDGLVWLVRDVDVLDGVVLEDLRGDGDVDALDTRLDRMAPVLDLDLRVGGEEEHTLLGIGTVLDLDMHMQTRAREKERKKRKG